MDNCLQCVAIDKISDIVCYGLGSFTTSVISRYQLALLLLFKEHFTANVYIYDPVFSDHELDILNKLQLIFIEENEEGARKIDTFTLIYMPHCPTALVNNLLWRNWGHQLSKCIILSNSFKALSQCETRKNFQERFHYIHSILPVTTEMDLKNNFIYTDIFNDLSLHSFPLTSLCKLSQEFWKKEAKPTYENADIECIRNKLQNSSITETSIETVGI